MISLETITRNRLMLIVMYLSTTYAFTGNIGIFHDIYVCIRYGMILLVATVILLTVRTMNINGFRISLPMFLLTTSIIAVCVISICVTSNKKGTIIQLFWLISSVLFSLVFYKTEPVKLLSVFLDGQIIIIIFQAITLLMFPSTCYSIHISEQVFRGSFYHKNALAQQMLFGIIVCICLLRTVKEKKTVLACKIIFSGIGSLILLILTDSGTAKACLIVIMLTYFIVIIKKWDINIPAFFIICTLCFLWGVFSGNKMLAYFLENILGRDATLTGRLRIWNRVLEIVKMKPLFGYGFNSFWDYNPSLAASALGMGAHNGLFELLLQVGYVGTVLFVLLLIWVGEKMKKQINDNALFENLFIAMLLTYALGERIVVPFVYTTIILLMIVIKYVDEVRKR